jgi:archaellum component FlaG (FlaF/FlaG flagellin family)
MGVVTGNVRIAPAGGGTPRDIAVSLTIQAAAAAGGSPQIVALDADDLLWGTSGSTGFYGQNLDGATAVNISPSQGITVDSVKSSSSTRVNMNLAVGATAPEGAHTMTVTTSRGVSNAFPFNVRRGQPQIRDLSPTVVNPGRFYASGGQVAFGMSGVDLTGVSSIQVDPPDSLTALPAVGSPSGVRGVVMVGDTAQIGTHRLSVVTPAGRTNELAFEIRSPSPNAPLISNLTVNSTSISSSGYSYYITYSGKLDFQDTDGDLTSGSNIFLMVDIGTGSEYITLVSDGGSYFNQNGKTSGTITFSFQKSFGLLYAELAGKVPILCMIQDAAGNLSNTLRTTVSLWDTPVL